MNRQRFADYGLIQAFFDAPSPIEPPDDPGNPTVNFHGQRRTNQTRVSHTDPETRLARKSHSKEAQLCYSAHVLMENRHGLCVAANLDAAGQATAAVGRLARTRFIGRWKITQEVLLTLSAYHLVRLTRTEVCP